MKIIITGDETLATIIIERTRAEYMRDLYFCYDENYQPRCKSCRKMIPTNAMLYTSDTQITMCEKCYGKHAAREIKATFDVSDLFPIKTKPYRVWKSQA